MFKFTIAYPSGLTLNHTAENYQAFLRVLVIEQAASGKILAWLVEQKDLRADVLYSYWNGGQTVYLRKEKADV